MLSVFETNFEKCERMWEGEPNAAPWKVIPSAAVPSLLRRTYNQMFAVDRTHCRPPDLGLSYFHMETLGRPFTLDILVYF